MPVICDQVGTKLSNTLSQSFKKTEKENIDTHPTPNAKLVLSTKIDYEATTSYNNSILSSLKNKYIVLLPNQIALPSNGNNTSKSLQKNGSSTSYQLPQPKKTLFARENVQVGWNSLGRNWFTGCGFQNVGNTCYLNSALQAFFHVPALVNWLVNDEKHRQTYKENREINREYHSSQGCPCIICAMSNTLIAAQRQNSMVPSLITNRLSTICKHMSIGRQEDSHEFLRYLVEQMEKSFLNRFKQYQWFKDLDQHSKETTPLNQILGGYLRSTVTCLACKHDSVTFQHFMDLPLDISRVSTLIEALGGYFARENLEECGYKCESCKKKVSATKRFSLERPPAVLCIQLKRFNVMGAKLGRPIQIVQNLDLQRYLSNRSLEFNQNCSYRLVSLVTHIGGSASGGHYTAIGLSPNGYHQFDDSCVTSVSNETVLRSSNAYVLFYELQNNKQKSYTNGQSHLNEHTYSKTAPYTSTTPAQLSLREGFAKPKLPPTHPMVPSAVMKNNHLKQKENETTPPTFRNGAGPSTSKANGISRVSTQLFPALKVNGKREASDDEGERDEVSAKKMKPSLPRLTADDEPATPLTPSTTSPTSSLASPFKPKSLVPYETDDEDDEPSSNDGKSVSFCKTSSGVFVETDIKDVNIPSKQGSTVDKTVVTKASLTNGSPKVVANGNYIKRTDDTLQQLEKLNHSGYGSSNVTSWDNTPSNMNREVDRDQQEERKRQMEDEDDMEMDSGRVKKVRTHSNGNGYHQQRLPNHFQSQQNVMNSNGGGNRQTNYYDRDRPGNNGNHNGNGYRSYQNGGHSQGFRNNNNNNYNKFKQNGHNHYKQRYNYQNHNKGNGGKYNTKFHKRYPGFSGQRYRYR